MYQKVENVKELIALLQSLPPEAPVYVTDAGQTYPVTVGVENGRVYL